LTILAIFFNKAKVEGKKAAILILAIREENSTGADTDTRPYICQN